MTRFSFLVLVTLSLTAFQSAIADPDKALKYYYECVSLTDDDAMCFEEGKKELLNYVLTTIDQTEPTCDKTRQKLVMMQQAIKKQRKEIESAALQAEQKRESGLQHCFNDRAKRASRIEALIGERARFTVQESRPAICRETFGFLTMLGIHAKLIGQQARDCYSSKLAPQEP